MKNTMLSLGMAALLFAACAEKKDANATEGDVAVDTTANEVVADTVQDAAVATDTVTDGAKITVEGKVTEINRGKDGYSAKMQTAEGKFYTATISIPNMTDPKQYRSVAVGDVINVIGELHDEIIVVRELKN
ncbi:hypothetical protein FMM05_01570 [Flavobacterium zepuense]|uniref:Lipoprotein n=1 Tax=Flavobacterium zepuense TaxID=2593302 RepID=A0A552VA52_9FLAO|nr:hypothetical protein [Flavobacterium zepuense]TRW27355.1 hypothetical protein FMM05_01570 [Flavobacterium zepuense]